MMRQKRSLSARLELSGVLLLSLILGLLLWAGRRQTTNSSTRSPLSTPLLTLPVIEDEVEIVYPPRPPTATRTRVPDDEPPVTGLIVAATPNAHNWYRTPLTFTFVATDDFIGLGLTWYRLTGAPAWQIHEYFYPPVVIAAEGRHTLTYYSEDANNNLEQPHTARFDIDLTPPTVTHTLSGVQATAGWYSPSVIITLTGQDNLSGLDHYEVNLNSRGWTTVTATYVVTAAGYHHLAYRAVDRAGNLSPARDAVFAVGEVRGIYLPAIFKQMAGED